MSDLDDIDSEWPDEPETLKLDVRVPAALELVLDEPDTLKPEPDLEPETLKPDFAPEDSEANPEPSTLRLNAGEANAEEPDTLRLAGSAATQPGWQVETSSQHQQHLIPPLGYAAPDRALASTMPPPIAVGPEKPASSSPPSAPEPDSRSPLELADRHAVRNPSAGAVPFSIAPATPRHVGLMVTDATAQMKACFATGDFSGALTLSASILEHDPEHVEAQRYSARAGELLIQMLEAKIGALQQIVEVAVPAEQIRWLSLDHRTGFLLSLVDGSSNVDQLLDISGMSRLEALRTLQTLLERHILKLR